jgi:kynureninase
MSQLIDKSKLMTGYLEYLLNGLAHPDIQIITPNNPEERGAQLSIKVNGANKGLFEAIIGSGVICDWREPDVIRVAPAPLYNRFEEVFRFVKILQDLL